MRKMTTDEARSTNGGWYIYQCKNCRRQIMVSQCWLLHLNGIADYWSVPALCSRCYSTDGWDLVSEAYN